MEKRAKFHGSMTALVTPFKDGKIDEPAYRALIDWQITSGLARPRAGRNDRREPDAHPRGAPPRRRHLHRRSARPGSGDRRRGLQQHRRGDRACPPRRAKRRRRRSGRHALLQQADAGRPLPALQGRQRRDRNSDHHLQHSPAKRRRHVGRHDEAAVRTAPTSSASRTRPAMSGACRASDTRWARTLSNFLAKT